MHWRKIFRIKTWREQAKHSWKKKNTSYVSTPDWEPCSIFDAEEVFDETDSPKQMETDGRT